MAGDKPRLSRLTAILIHLQSKRIVTAQELARRFEVSRRTVYRDIKTLEEAGIPIGSENGVGYFIVDGYTLPPVSITEDGFEISSKSIGKSIKRSFNSSNIWFD